MTQSLNILLVDDEPGVLFALKMLLGLLPATVVVANSGKEAISLFNSTDFDLVISDLRMPEMNGLELFRELQKQSVALKFILISGHAAHEEQNQALADGVDAFLPKPFSLPQIKEAIASISPTAS